MTEESLARILESYEHLSPRIDALTRSFYAKLFAANPQLRPLFKLDIDVQSQHLAAALALIIRNLRLLDVRGTFESRLAHKGTVVLPHRGEPQVRQSSTQMGTNP